MTNEKGPEATLSPADVRAILTVCSPDGLLVGGQALAFWADYLQVRLPADLSSGVTADADFIGDAQLAKKLANALAWSLWIPSVDDPTPQTGKVTRLLKSGRVKQVDFLSGVVGLNTQELFRRAVEMQISGIGTLRVIHPIDVLESRIQNLHLLPGKRTTEGIAQATLAVHVARAFIRRDIQMRGEKKALKLLERVVRIAGETAGIRVFLQFGVDPLASVPLEDFRTTSSLHARRWPQVLAEIGGQRARRSP